MTPQEERAARIKAVTNKSLKLMKMDANGTLDKIAEGKRGDINTSLNESGTLLENNPMQGSGPNPTRQFNVNRISPAAGNVPSVIRESFQSQPPVGQQEMTSSVLDTMLGDMFVQQTTTKPIMEEVQHQPQQIAPQYSSQIDYPMIRTIVEEIVRKYTSSLSKKMINEN